MVNLEEFKKLDIKVAKVLEAKDHPNADKLLVLKIDTGEKQKQIVAGIKNFYEKDDLIGKQIVILDNLEPVTLRGEISQGMLLAALSEGVISLLVPDQPVTLGATIK
ncbi:methionine--tRNA ligase subunit beta [Candidatus Omnitrophota bacterium]